MSDEATAVPGEPAGLLAELARQLVSRDRSSAELARGLAEAGYGPAEVALALEAARERGWIDDSRLARELATRAAGRGRGRERVEAELIARGFDRNLAHSAWDDAVAAGEIDEEAALARAVARFRAPADAERNRRRLYNSLLRAGFEHDQILRVVGDGEEPRSEDDSE